MLLLLRYGASRSRTKYPGHSPLTSKLLPQARPAATWPSELTKHDLFPSPTDGESASPANGGIKWGQSFNGRETDETVEEVLGEDVEDQDSVRREIQMYMREKKRSFSTNQPAQGSFLEDSQPAQESPLLGRQPALERVTVVEALQEENPHKLLPSLLEAFEDLEYVRSISATTFSEILRLLDPKDFIDPYKAVYRDIHPASISHLADGTLQLQDILDDYSSAISAIVEARRNAGHRLGIVEYKSILRMVRSTGDARTAKMIWEAMAQDRIQPDTVCYNYYFEALCWANAYDPAERERFRVMPYHLSMRKRSDDKRQGGFQGHRVGPYGGLKSQVLKLFNGMVRAGVTTNVDTFIMLMTAMAREGDIDGVKAILKRVWDVNADNDSLYEMDATQLRNDIPPNSPLYPTTRLLFTTAHIFGSNNQLSLALRLVDFISQKYSIAIDRSTWSQLLEWAFVLSVRRHGPRRTDGATLGQVPAQSVEKLWNIMVSEPYNIEPTMPMLNRYCKNLWQRQMGDAMLEQMRAGVKLHIAQVDRGVAHSHRTFAESSEAHSRKLNQESELHRLKAYRDHMMVSRWFRLLLALQRWGGRALPVQRREIPNVVDEFWNYRPRAGIEYTMFSGRVLIYNRQSSMVILWGKSPIKGICCIWDITPPVSGEISRHRRR
ncbi:hypothetical protein MMC20_003259 [Loxospora ochrophaea]|nr:hypothetical protein [Loxospora ochrophaea]